MFNIKKAHLFYFAVFFLSFALASVIGKLFAQSVTANKPSTETLAAPSEGFNVSQRPSVKTIEEIQKKPEDENSKEADGESCGAYPCQQ